MPLKKTSAPVDVKILLLEDSDIDADLITHQLRKLGAGAAVFRADIRRDYYAMLQDGSFDIILSDYSLPDFDGVEALNIAQELAPMVPFIFVSGVVGEQFATEALRSGATDYVTKKDIGRIPAVVARALKEAEERKSYRRAVRALRESEARFRVTADSTPALIWSVDADGRLDFANSRFEAEFGLSRTQLLGGGWLSLINPDDVEEFTAAFAACFQARHVFRHQVRVRDKQGATRWLRCEANPRIDESGHFFGYTACAIDVTDVKMAKDLLEEKVALRTEELREKDEALRQAQKMESIGQLTGGIAHDFNNMLAGIMGSAELLRKRLREKRHDDCERYLDVLLSAANRAASLTHRLLAFSRRQTLDIHSVDTNLIIRSLYDLLSRTLGSEIELELALDPALWLSASDAHQLENALLNLAINARDAMPNGGKLSIATRNRTIEPDRDKTENRPGDYVELTVSDTGMGMTAETLERAFEPFFTTKPIGQGTGLGLSMIYGFVTQTGGRVKIASTPGRGTSVSLLLPRGKHVVDVEPSFETARPNGPVSRKTVLVVEDEALVRLLLVDYLQELGYDIIEAWDAKSALPIIESARPFDLLLTDVGLPGTNGRQLADMARQVRPELPVLFATGYAQGADSKTGFLGPGMDMVAKPYALDVLGNKISRMIEA